MATQARLGDSKRMHRTIFFISDGTGITAEAIGHSLLSQFQDLKLDQVRIPFVDSMEAAHAAVTRINKTADKDGVRPIVINTVVAKEVGEVLSDSNGFVLDFFATFLQALERELGVDSSPRVGQAHGIIDSVRYEARISATNYALSHDDGQSPDFEQADVILLGVSRSGKTPTCLYMALNYGIKAANYPLTEEDEGANGMMQLPKSLTPHKNKLFGLTIDAQRLAQIREARRPGSRYASARQCQLEVMEAEDLFRRNGISYVSTTHTSIEEISSKVMLALGMNKTHF
ncbi:MAG: putative phosphoenolpyruvate synthase regulatory protein [Lysobacteraceae bacterium]|nr:MAG: putative phosphoenolpyruvate synthase regulatory protein [Xanthomonadaceae bacterium]